MAPSSDDELVECPGPVQPMRESHALRATSQHAGHGRRGAASVQVVGCGQVLQGCGTYCLRKHICPDHLKADAVRCEGMGDELWRFCQQCGKLEVLDHFEGSKRSCMTSLRKRRLHSTESKQAGNKRQQLALLGAPPAAEDSPDRGDSCCFSGSDHCNNDVAQAAAAAAALAAAWCGYPQEQHAAWAEPRQSSNGSSLPSCVRPAAGAGRWAGTCAGAGDVYILPAACSSMPVPVSPAAAAALLAPGTSCFHSSISCSTSTCCKGIDDCEDALLDWMLEMEGELLAAGILATNSNAAQPEEDLCSFHGNGHAAAAVLHQPQSSAAAAAPAAVNIAHPGLLTSSSCCPPAVPVSNWPPVNVPATPVHVPVTQQLPNSFAAPVMPSVAHFSGVAQIGAGFSAAAAPVAPGASALPAAGSNGADRFQLISTKLQALTAEFGQLQRFMDELKVLRYEEAAIKARLASTIAAAAAPAAATYSDAWVGWQ